MAVAVVDPVPVSTVSDAGVAHVLGRGNFRRFGVPVGAAEDRLHARRELARAEGLYEIIVAADFEPEHAIEFGVARGEEARKGGALLQLHAEGQRLHRQAVGPGVASARFVKCVR